jgi:hypothetical protein
VALTTCVVGMLAILTVTKMFNESRRSTRVPLKVTITVEAGTESRSYDGETLVVSLHGAPVAYRLLITHDGRLAASYYSVFDCRVPYAL